MKAFHLNELAGFVGLFQKYTGAQLQEVTSSEKQLLLRFRLHKNYYLLFDLTASHPLMFWLEEKAHIHKKVSPLSLFLKKYFINSKLQDVRLISGEGRILHFHFQSTEYGELELEARLYPHGQNLIAKASDKTIAWTKPKEVSRDSSDISPVHDINEIQHNKWSDYNANKKVAKVKVEHDPLQKNQELLLQLKKGLENFIEVDYKSIIESIRQNQSLEGLSSKIIAPHLAWYEAIELLVNKEKKQQQKLQNIKKRIQSLEKAIQDGKGFEQSPKKDLFNKSEARGRVKVLLDGRRAYVGKSAKDNMQLLRKAKPWYLWMHIRDQPGAHLILQQNKDQPLAELDLLELANFLAKESGFAKTLQEGDVFEIQYSECRYIKPIKGDKLGRVIVQKEKTHRIRFKH